MSTTVRSKADLQKSFDKVFGNSLIVDLICSNTDSVKDFLSFRQLNRVFYREATKRLRSTHKPIDLSFRFEEFLSTLRGRFEQESMPFPFSSFRFHLDALTIKTLRQFLAGAGQHTRYLQLEDLTESIIRVKSKLTAILSGTPNLEKLHFKGNRPIHLTTSDIGALPASFPRLRSIHIHYLQESKKPSSEDSVLLLNHLITITTHLKDVYVPGIVEKLGQADGMTVFRLIAQHHGAHLPNVALGKSSIRPSTLPALRELTGMGLNFQKFSVELFPRSYFHDYNTPRQVEVQNLRNCISWLVTQSELATSLQIDLDEFRRFQLSIPVLPALKKLKIVCGIFRLDSIRPFTLNQFPALDKLIIEDYNDISRIFVHCSLPTVRELRVLGRSDQFRGPWHRILPNLTVLRFETGWASSTADKLNLEFFLMHFHRVTELEIIFRAKQNCWAVLTGGASRPRTIDQLLHGELGVDIGIFKEPIDGVYPHASLRNLGALKRLKFGPGSRANLDAILYMTRAGFLGPLEYIELVDIDLDIKIKRRIRAAYRNKLAEVHAEVDFDFNFNMDPDPNFDYDSD